VTTTTALAGLLGVGVAAGLLLIATGRRAGAPNPRPRTRAASGRDGGGRRVPQYLVVVVVGVAATVLTGWIVGGVLAGIAAVTLPRVLRPDTAHTKRLARIEAIASWTEMMRDTLSAAAGLEQTILATAPLAPAAIGEDITDLATRLRRGQRLAPALRTLADRLADPTADLVLAALILAAERQSRSLADLLGSLARVARDQAALRMRVQAGRARIRTSVRVIVGTTTTMATALIILNRPYLAAYDTATGQVVLALIGGLFATGYVWLARIATPEEPARILTDADLPRREAVTPW